eukprot:COSAG06_NODE_28255_length_577_cov_5.700837_1_plen_70_part_10
MQSASVVAEQNCIFVQNSLYNQVALFYALLPLSQLPALLPRTAVAVTASPAAAARSSARKSPPSGLRTGS